jgi:pimeloyl-ACP methyl ester carboxylesterase
MRVFACTALVTMFASCAPRFQEQAVDLSKWGARFETLDGFTLHCKVVGEGKPVLYLHGFSSFLNVWEETAARLAAVHRSILVDLPGHGLSDRRDSDYTPAGVAGKVAGLLDRLGERKVSIVAHSWGASVALAFALAHPDRVDRLVVVDGWVYSEQSNTFMDWCAAPGVGDALMDVFYDQQMEYRYAMAFHDPKAWMDEDIMAPLRKVMALPGSRAAALAILRGLKSLPAQEARYGEVKSPTLCIWCRDDQVAYLHYGERLARELPDARLVVLPDCNHMPVVEQPHRFAMLLKEFL